MSIFSEETLEKAVIELIEAEGYPHVKGDTVNVAYRIQEYARPYKIVVGPATVAAIVEKFNTQRIGAVTLRGREKPIQVYEVLP